MAPSFWNRCVPLAASMRILLTGYADMTSTVNAINKGEIYRYVSKPWDDHDIVLMVRDALQSQQLQSENSAPAGLDPEARTKSSKRSTASLEARVRNAPPNLSRSMASSTRQRHAQAEFSGLDQGLLDTPRTTRGVGRRTRPPRRRPVAQTGHPVGSWTPRRSRISSSPACSTTSARSAFPTPCSPSRSPN
jgi:hypothetical protein